MGAHEVVELYLAGIEKRCRGGGAFCGLDCWRGAFRGVDCVGTDGVRVLQIFLEASIVFDWCACVYSDVNW